MDTKNAIKIVIADDHALIAETWAALINLEPDFNVVKVYDNTQSLLDELHITVPDVVIMDINISPISGIDATKLAKDKFPRVKIIGVSMHNQPSFAKKMIRNGASGYVTKNSTKTEMYLAIREVMKGNRYICQEIQRNISQIMIEDDNSKISTLTEREIEIIRLIKDGKKNQEIADLLFISRRTVETHRARILKKLDLNNSISLIKYINESFMDL